MPDPNDLNVTAAAEVHASAASSADETAAGRRERGGPVPGFGLPAAPSEVGTLGPYRVVTELGRGGMGAVYAAVDTRLDRRLALKVMLPEFAADAGAKGRFLREARAAAKVKHDNVVVVYEADERDGVPYIAMEFLDGLPLDAYLKKKGGAPLPQVVRIAAEAAAGLAAAHAIGLVHRDIKPANLWLEAPNGRVKVLDFGLARPVDAEVELTQSGAVVGTPAYMSPEQARGERVDHRTDLFSLGSVLYRLCTGKLPFPGPSTMAVLMALGTEEPPPVRELNPDVPGALAALIHQLLSKPIDARPRSADEVRQRLYAIAQDLAAPRGVELSVSRPQVVYVATPVTAAEANPFADIDAPDVEQTAPDEADDPSDVVPLPPKPRRWLWPAVGLAALVLAAGGLFVAIGNKGVPTAETPAGVPPAAPAVAARAADPDRAAAEWALALGGAVRINGENDDIKSPAELPKERFTLRVASLSSKPVTDAGLAQLRGLKGLTDLTLANTGVTDAGLSHLNGLVGLRVLDLPNTGVTDAGLVHLKDLKRLGSLSLNSTKVSGAGVDHLRELKGLTFLGLFGTAVSDAEVARLKEHAGLTGLNLGGTRVSDAGLAHLGNMKELTELTLIATRVSDAGLAHLRALKKLTYLDVRQTTATTKGLAEFHAAVPGCRVEHDGGVIEPDDVDRAAAEYALSLKAVVRINGLKGEKNDIKTVAGLPKDKFALTSVFFGWTEVTDEGLAKLKWCTDLTHFNVYATKVSDAGLAHFAHFAGTPTLTHLSVGGTKVTATGLANFRGCTGLTYLDVSYTQAGPAGLEHFKDCKALNHVELCYTQVTDAGLAHLAGCTQLKRLNLSANGLKGAGLVHLKDCEALTFLDLGANPLTDESFAHLKGLTALKELRLHETPVTDAGLQHLKGLANMTTLHLKKTKVTEKGVKELAAALPACRIEWDGGVIEAIDVDRRAARWVLESGGAVRVNGTDKDVKAVGDLPKDRFALTEVLLADTPTTDADLERLKGLRGLTGIDLRDTKVTGTGLVHLRGLPALTSLGLQHTPLTDAGLAQLKELKGLTKLALSCNPVTDAGLAHLKELKGLTQLWLWQTPVSDAGLEHLKGLESLAHLDLRHTRVTGSGLAHLKGLTGLKTLLLLGAPVADEGVATVTASLPGLTILELNDTKVTDAGLVHLVGLKGLEFLALSDTKVTDAGLAHLARLNGLKGLDVQRTKVTAKGAADLHAVVPGCRVLHVGGVIEPKK